MNHYSKKVLIAEEKVYEKYCLNLLKLIEIYGREDDIIKYKFTLSILKQIRVLLNPNKSMIDLLVDKDKNGDALFYNRCVIEDIVIDYDAKHVLLDGACLKDLAANRENWNVLDKLSILLKRYLSCLIEAYAIDEDEEHSLNVPDLDKLPDILNSMINIDLVGIINQKLVQINACSPVADKLNEILQTFQRIQNFKL